MFQCGGRRAIDGHQILDTGNCGRMRDVNEGAKKERSMSANIKGNLRSMNRFGKATKHFASVKRETDKNVSQWSSATKEGRGFELRK